MKVFITENKFKDTVRLSLKELGTESTINNIGGWENFSKVLNIESPTDFLHLFDDLEQVQSEKREGWSLFRYKKGHNYIIYDILNEDVYINYYEIWSILHSEFGLTPDETKSLTQKWLDEVYNLRGVTTSDFDEFGYT